VTTVAYECDYGLLLFTNPIDDHEIMRLIHQGLVDGVNLMEVLRNDSRVELMKQSSYPFGLIGLCGQNDGISFVDMERL
jgi:DNA-binding LacI/PurR family transcriptional regulator